MRDNIIYCSTLFLTAASIGLAGVRFHLTNLDAKMLSRIKAQIILGSCKFNSSYHLVIGIQVLDYLKLTFSDYLTLGCARV